MRGSMKTKTIFLIDDEVELLEIFKECFATPNNEIITFDNHVDALKLAKEKKPDLIIIDSNLNGVSGIEVIKLFDESIPKHLCSGHSYKNIPQGFTSVFEKPFNMEEMIKLVS